MRNILIITFFAFYSNFVQSQILTPVNGYGQQHKRIQVDSFLKPPSDTIYNAPFGSFAIKSNKIFLRNSTKWDLFSTSSIDSNRIAFKAKSNIFTDTNKFTSFTYQNGTYYVKNSVLNQLGTNGGFYIYYDDSGSYSISKLTFPYVSNVIEDSVAYRKWVRDYIAANSGSGTVTSVGLTAPTGFSVSNSPITSSGNIGLSFASGYSLPTTASQTLWDNAYTNRITSATTPLSIASNNISIAQASSTLNGYLSSTDWNTFNNKGSGTVTSVAALTLGTSGTDLSSTVANGTTTPTITLNVPNASASNRGVLTTAAQTLGGQKTFANGVILGNQTAAGEFLRVAYNSSVYYGFNILSNNEFRISPGTAGATSFNITRDDGSTSVFNVDVLNYRAGVNTASPSYSLHVINPNTYGIGSLGLQGNGGVGGSVNFIKTSGGATGDEIGIVSFRNNGTERARISSTQDDGTNDNGSLKFYTTATGGSITERGKFTTNGNFLIGTTTNVSNVILRVISTTKASHPYPSMTSAQRTALTMTSSNYGDHVYQTDGTEGVYVYKSTGWVFAY